jgi:uncharacterized membrane protein YfcA
MNYLIAIAIGLLAGVSSGLFGVGGGVIIVPLVVALYGFNQQQGSATSLVALLLPVGALGVWQYYRSGFLGVENFKYGGLIALGLLFGTLLGARLAGQMTSVTLARLFSGYLFIMAIRIWFTAK